MAFTTAAALAATLLLAVAATGTTALLAIDGSTQCSVHGAPPAFAVACGSPASEPFCPDGDAVRPARNAATGMVRIDLWNKGGQSETRICVVDTTGAKPFDSAFALERDERMDVQIPLPPDVYDVFAILEGDRIAIRIERLDIAWCTDGSLAMDLDVDRKMLGRLHTTLTEMRCAPLPAAPSPDGPEKAGTLFGALLPNEPLSREAVRATALATAAIGTAAAGVAVLGRSHRFHWLILGLFTRINRKKALDHPIRSQAHELVNADPGIGPEEIRRTLALSHAQVALHLRTLERTGLVVHVRTGRRSHFFPPGEMSPAEMRRHAILRAPAARRLLDTLRTHGDTDVTGLARAGGWSIPYTSRLAARLRRAGLVDAERIGHRMVLRPAQGMSSALPKET